MSGTRLLATIAIAIAAMVALIVITSDGGIVETGGAVIRWTARTSLVAFVLAYIARPAVQIYRHAITKRLLAERKWIGLGYATSHLAHLGGIVVVASQDIGGFVSSQSVGAMIGSVTYVFLFAMAVTSIDAVRKAMSARAWKLVHRTGMHLSWISFAGTYAIAATQNVVYAIPTVLLLGAASVRLAAWLRGRRPRTELAKAV
ncbi:MAG: ferric reductase-like transmembrane domain-containing protein [Kofleriaceae bacterium]